MQIHEAMASPVDTCEADETVADAARRMVESAHGALPVTVQGRLAGIITERDVLTAVAARRSLDATKVGELMTPHPDSLEPGFDVTDAADWMLAAGYRHLPVVSDGQVLGMVSIKDVMWALTGGTKNLNERLRSDHNP